MCKIVGAPPVWLVRQAPDYRVTRLALASAASTPPPLTSDPARQHHVVWPNALARHLQPQAIQAHESTQIRTIKDSLEHAKVIQIDGVEISIIERPRPLPGHDTPNATHNTYTPKCEEPINDYVRVFTKSTQLVRGLKRAPSVSVRIIVISLLIPS